MCVVGILMLSLVTALWLTTPSEKAADIIINAKVTYQTMSGWEADSFSGQWLESNTLGISKVNPSFALYKDQLFDSAVNDLGVNRIRLGIRGGVENNAANYFTQYINGQITDKQLNQYRNKPVNDNDDPGVVNAAGFQWAELDYKINNIIIPLRQKLAARGESLFVNVCFVASSPLSFDHSNNPQEYAEFVLATYQHMQSTFGFFPDAWEVILEPDATGAQWTQVKVANAVLAAGDRLVVNGFNPNFVVGSAVNHNLANGYFDTTMTRLGAAKYNYVGELSYHLYGGQDDTARANTAARMASYGVGSGMLEFIGATYNILHKDLKIANITAWQQFTLGSYFGTDDGSMLYFINQSNPNAPVVTIGSRTKFLRQYFKFIRRGAVRVGATTNNANFDPVAFRNTNGKQVVVVKAASGGSFNIQGLPAGTYGIKFTTASQYDVDAAPVTISAGQLVVTSIPAAGVITVYGTSVASPAPTPDRPRLTQVPHPL
jgi:hypothetical protein